MHRRQFLSAALVGLTAKAERRISGSFVNESFPLGHKLRDHQPFTSAKQIQKIPIVIVGGGIAGLSAAWRLTKRNFHDFVLLEMEPQPGGNSRWGENEITAFPWAAHYVPVPGPRATLVRELFTELGVLHKGVWDERALCFAPKERLFINGEWRSGLESVIGITGRDRAEFKRFGDEIVAARATGQF